MMRKQMKYKLLSGITIALPFLNAFILLYCLNHYQAHMEVEFFSVITSLISCIVSVFITIYTLIRKLDKGLLILCLFSVTVCLAIFIIARSIPLCPLCEGLKPEDLGLLSHWISCDP